MTISSSLSSIRAGNVIGTVAGGYAGYYAGGVIKFAQEAAAWGGIAYSSYAKTGMELVNHAANGAVWLAAKISFLPPEALMIAAVVIGGMAGWHYGGMLLNRLGSMFARQPQLT